jgi:hypothetical protein
MQPQSHEGREGTKDVTKEDVDPWLASFARPHPALHSAAKRGIALQVLHW